MARPRLSPTARRTRTVCARLTEAEARELAARAASAGEATSVYVRRRALGEPVRHAAVQRLGAEERVELRRIGVNLNQIARALNAGGRVPTGVLAEVKRVRDLVADLLEGRRGE